MRPWHKFVSIHINQKKNAVDKQGQPIQLLPTVSMQFEDTEACEELVTWWIDFVKEKTTATEQTEKTEAALDASFEQP
jgi:hypothetical protein